MQRVVEAELPGPGPPQRLEVGAAAEQLPDVVRERADVEAGAADEREAQQRRSMRGSAIGPSGVGSDGRDSQLAHRDFDRLQVDRLAVFRAFL